MKAIIEVDINEFQLTSLQALLAKSKHAHTIDAIVYKDNLSFQFEADWFKDAILRVT